MGVVTKLLGLSVHVSMSAADDLALIFAEPELKDMEVLLPEKYILDIVYDIFGAKIDPYKNKDTSPNIQYGSADLDVRPDENKTDDLVSTAIENLAAAAEDSQLKDETISTDFQEENVGEVSDEPETSNEISTSNPPPFHQVGPGKFSCNLCSKMSFDRSNAYKHAKTHGLGLEPVEDRTCQYCKKIFHYSALLRKHIKRKCKAMMQAKCESCEVVFESGHELKKHIKLEHDYEKLKCSYCDHIASSTQNKSNHEKRMHLSMNCKQCKKLFNTLQEKETHVCQEPDRHKCDKCDKSYKAKSELRNHMMVVHEGVKHPCSFCDDVLSSVQALRRHQKSFHQNNPKDHICEICSQAFTHKDTLKKHILTHDKIMRSDPCPYCGKVLRNRNVLREHIKSIHEKNFSIVCEDCGEKFANKHRLEIHSEMVHLNGKMYVCTICGKECLGKRRLQNHMVSKHPKGQKFVTCQYCGDDVGEKQLRSHIVEAHKSHSYKFQCPHCLKKFPVKGHIKRHIRVHTGARPYLCRGCGNHFVDLEAVKDHIRKEHGGDVSLAHYDINKDVNNPYA